MKCILDTNVISELVAPKPNPNVLNWIESVDPEEIFLSVITIGELKKGIAKLPNSERRAILDDWLNNDLLVRFEEHLIPIDSATMLTWGDLIARLEAAGKPMPAIDSLLAASAICKGCTLVTRNTGDFEHADVVLVNPWEY